jgi:hypothetical protein
MHSFGCSGEFEYELYLRYDLYTKRNTQWYYFRVQNIQSNKRYRFTIVNFLKVATDLLGGSIFSERSLDLESVQQRHATVDVQCP